MQEPFSEQAAEVAIGTDGEFPGESLQPQDPLDQHLVPATNATF